MKDLSCANLVISRYLGKWVINGKTAFRLLKSSRGFGVISSIGVHCSNVYLDNLDFYQFRRNV
jgi:hypothetical protein